MAALFADVPDALDNAVALAKRCNLELRLGTYYLPAFPVPDDDTLDSWIRSAGARRPDASAWRKRRSPPATRASRLRTRLEIELDVIIKMGFPGYFLIVADFINWAKRPRHSRSARAAVRVPVRWSRGRWASPTSTRCPTTCCSSASSIPNACRCPTSTSTSAWTAATR